MFTGIITHQGIVRRRQALRENAAVSLSIPRVRLRRGDSVAINGVCLTIASAARGLYNVVIMPETLRHTTLRRLQESDRVNVELPLKHGQPYGGHFVLGHVDTVGKIVGVQRDCFTAAFIPYTLQHTTLRTLTKGSQVNIEFDILARYIHAASS